MEKKENLIVSLGREFGAGGRSVGKKLAERLGIAYYDKELIVEAAKEFGFAPELFEKSDETSSSVSGNVLQWMSDWMDGLYSRNFLSQDSLFEMQSATIRKIASERSCVILGRCSDYVLRDNPNCVSVFLHSTEDDRAQRIIERSEMTKEEAMKLMGVEDKRRASYYNFYSNKTWGMASTYHLSVNVASLGDEGVVDFIIDFLKRGGFCE
jgi:cytidylate kinase